MPSEMRTKLLSVIFISVALLIIPVHFVLAEDSQSGTQIETITSQQSQQTQEHEVTEPTEAPIVVNNTNEANTSSDISAESDTGTNTETDSIVSSDIITGDASASAGLDTEVNTNITGGAIETDIVHIHEPTAGDISLAESSGICHGASQQPIVVSNENDAHIVNTITVAANTGNNEADGLLSNIETGDATASAQISTIANTNLTGECGYLGVVNVFEEHEGNIILPNDQNYLHSDNQTGGKESPPSLVTNTNDGTLSGSVTATATTGDNSAQVIDTGSGIVTVRQIDEVNTNITGDNWLMVKVNNAYLWDGTFVGWNGNIYRDDTYAMAWTQVPSGFSVYGSVTNTNRAEVENNIRVSANTGGNTASGIASSVSTGNANANVSIFNMINTNLTGANWYYVLVNLFDTLKGDIVFPRINLGLQFSADRSNVRPGDESIVTGRYTNTGSVVSQGTTIDIPIPSGVEVTAIGAGGRRDGITIRYYLGALLPGETGAIWFRVRLTGNTIPSTITVSGTIYSTGQDTDPSNNHAAVAFTLFEQAIAPVKPNTVNKSDETIEVVYGMYDGDQSALIPKPEYKGTVLGDTKSNSYVYVYDGKAVPAVSRISTRYGANEPVNMYAVVAPVIAGGLILALLKKYAKFLLFEY